MSCDYTGRRPVLKGRLNWVGQGQARLPVKQAGLALPDSVQTAPENWTASCVIIGHLVAALKGQVVFRTADHSACLWKGRTAVRKRWEIRA